MRWINIHRKKPKLGICVLVCDSRGDINIEFTSKNWESEFLYGNGSCVVAWQPLPKPYRMKSNVSKIFNKIKKVDKYYQ